MSNSNFENQENEIDVWAFINLFWTNKKIISYITAIAAFISLIYAFSLPNIYKAGALIAPAGQEGSRDISSMVGQFGGIASLAGISLNEDGLNKSDLGLEVLRSRKFVREFVARHKIAPQLMAVDYWDVKTQKLVIDRDIYDEKNKSWVVRGGPPSNEKIYNEFLRILIIEKYNNSKFVRVGFKHRSPNIAAEWTSLVIQDLNNAIRSQDITEAENSIAYLKEQAQESPLADLRKLFYNLIQSQTETMMLANVREEYVFKTIDPATVPELKSEPKRLIILILGTLLGGLFALIYMFVKHYLSTFQYSKSAKETP